jgi:hypothetical protein
MESGVQIPDRKRTRNAPFPTAGGWRSHGGFGTIPRWVGRRLMNCARIPLQADTGLLLSGLAPILAEAAAEVRGATSGPPELPTLRPSPGRHANELTATGH